jgi:hypothetical protein
MCIVHGCMNCINSIQLYAERVPLVASMVLECIDVL